MRNTLSRTARSVLEVIVKRFIQLAIALTFFFVTEHALAVPLPANPLAATNDRLIVRAQGLQIEFGVSDSMILSVLSRHGYSLIRITKKKLTKARAEACKGGIKYDVEIGFDGRIRRAKQIGNCRPVINVEIARKILMQKGFRIILLNAEGNRFVAAVCRNNRRFRVVMDQFGGIQGEKVLGRCGGILTQYDVAAMLRARGYSRVRTKKARRGGYSVEACRNDDRVALRVGNDGVILREQRTGRCEPPIHPATIPALLARLGFTRINVIDRQLPRYLAHACRGTQRLEISMNRFGGVVDERSIGRCEPPLNAAGLQAKLKGMGYASVRIVEVRANGFVAEVCEDASLIRLELTTYGETVSQQRLGDCPSRGVGRILQDLESKGLYGATMYVEGCRNRKRVRIALDRSGSIVGRRVIGRCR